MIEGSREDQQAGEYVIDVAEYSQIKGQPSSVDYFQLKHSTVRTHLKVTLSNLKETLGGFANRYKASSQNLSNLGSAPQTTFSVVSNRCVSQRVKDTVQKITNGDSIPKKLESQWHTITSLRNDQLRKFCSVLNFIDGEGDYVVQKEKLQTEVTEYIAGFVHTDDLGNLLNDELSPKRSNVVSLMDALRKSLETEGGASRKKPANQSSTHRRAPAKHPSRKKAS